MQHGDAEVLAKGGLNGGAGGAGNHQSLLAFGDAKHISLCKGVKGYSRRGLGFKLKPWICGAEGKQSVVSNGPKSSMGQAKPSLMCPLFILFHCS